MKKTVFSLATLIGLSAGGAAFAQALDFNALDADMNGEITMEELQVAIPDLTEDSFGMLDADGDGVVSAEEFAALTAGGAAAPNTEAPATTMAPAAPATEAPAQ